MTKLQFTKNGVVTSWNDSTQFPTIETSEAVVRSDMQLFHDETKTAFNKLIDDLADTTDGSSGADEIGCTSVGSGSARTVQGVLEELNTAISQVSPKGFHAGTTAPANTNLLWIDTTANTGGLKYYNGSAWVTVPVRFA